MSLSCRVSLRKSLKKVKIELISIGAEVLLGNTLNTNFKFIGSKLLDNGFILNKEQTIPDDIKVIKESFKSALSRSDVVISTGGLGPTIDDITKKAAASLFSSDFTVDKSVLSDLIKRYGKTLPTLQHQATIPKKSMPLKNEVGTAPGLIFRKGKKALILLPGVPAEMQPMLINQVIPILKEEFHQNTKLFIKKISLFDIPEFVVDPFLLSLKEKYGGVEFGIYPKFGTLEIHLTVFDEDKRGADKKLSAAKKAITKKFSKNLFESSSGQLEEALQKLFIKNGWTLSVAESCTGGKTSATITKLPGASNYFIGGVIAYSNTMKKDLLGVSENLIAQKGAVSQEVVTEMVKGALKLSGSTFALAVSGIAGPGGRSAEKPVGTVWMAICRRGKKPITWKEQFVGTREIIITRSVNSLLGNLLQYCRR